MTVNLFDPKFYAANNSDLAKAGLTTDAQLLSHFQQYGINEGRQFSPFFDYKVYSASNPDLAKAGLTTNKQLLEHAQTYGVKEARKLSAFLDLNYYLQLYPDLQKAFGNDGEKALQHLQTYGLQEGRVFSPVFDENYYRSLYPDLQQAGLNNTQLLNHFETYGLKEGRAGSFRFDVSYYLNNNSDLKTLGFNNQQALQHFAIYGAGEGRAGTAGIARAQNRTTLGNGPAITPQGWFLTPAGRQISLGDRPYGMAISPDGNTVLVSNDGLSVQSLMVVDRVTGTVVQTIQYQDPEALNYGGVTFSHDGKKAYASGGGKAAASEIRVYNVNGQQLTETAPIVLPQPKTPDGRDIVLYPTGLTISNDDKTLYVADNTPPFLGAPVDQAGFMSVIDLTTNTVKAPIAVGHNPYTVALSNDNKTAYVSNWGDTSVTAVDTASLKTTATIAVGTHPNAIAVNPKNNEIYVTNADSDNVSVIDSTTNKVIRTIDLAPYPGAKEGSSPNALTVSPDGKTLYVANATNNDVVVINLNAAGDTVTALIPTAWYPTGVVLTPDGKELQVINAKGLGAGPNTTGVKPNDSKPYDQYVGSMILGTLSQIDVSNTLAFPGYTKEVIANNGFSEGAKVRYATNPNENVIPLRPGDPSPIKHVIYVIKENRTYDQVLGSLGKGNGDPSINLFGDESAPNQRALAKQFVTLDNFYADAEVSADGWNWSTAALANNYVQKNWPADYSDSGRNRPYDFEGGNYATSPGKDPKDAFIWNKLSDAGISYRNYGFRVFKNPLTKQNVVASTPDGTGSTEPRLAANTDTNFNGFDMSQSDQPRVDEWLKEFKQYEASSNLPAVEFVRLPSDHTSGTTAGKPTPRAYMADNDLALGRVVDAVSHSADWASTAIFVVEDDAQDGPDHVDAHRTIAQVISPYTQNGKVDSTFYSTVSMLRTMELIAGIKPMSQFDAAATPMLNSFSDRPNLTAYSAITPTQKLDELNPVTGALAALGASNDLSGADRVPHEALNEQIWKSVNGADSEMPTPYTVFPQLQDSPGGAADGNPN